MLQLCCIANHEESLLKSGNLKKSTFKLDSLLSQIAGTFSHADPVRNIYVTADIYLTIDNAQGTRRERVIVMGRTLTSTESNNAASEKCLLLTEPPRVYGISVRSLNLKARKN